MSRVTHQTDPFGQAIADFYRTGLDASIEIRTSLGEDEKLPASYFFRSFNACPMLEQLALELCRGRVLDVGAGAGSHSLNLQRRGIDVSAMDSSELAVITMRQRGLNQVVHADFMNCTEQGYDTLLMLMNGMGLVGTLDQLPAFFDQARRILNPGGQVLVDSSDLIDLYCDDDGVIDLRACNGYYGQVQYQIRYGQNQQKFNWLFVDSQTLAEAALEHGFDFELLAEGVQNDYLARLTVLPQVLATEKK